MARILVLDENAIYRGGLCALISTQMPQAQVLAAKCLIEASPQIQNARFDLVLLGLDLSNSETVDTLRVAREASAATRFAIISAADTRGDILATLAAGLHGFISKHQSDTEILAAINDILSGRTYVYPVHVMTRKSFGLMTRKLSVTESQRSAQFPGTFSRRKLSVASANWAQVA